MKHDDLQRQARVKRKENSNLGGSHSVSEVELQPRHVDRAAAE